MQIEYRSSPAAGVPTVHRASGKKGVVLSGYGAIFWDGSPGSQYWLMEDTDGKGGVVERLLPGCFDKTLRSGSDILSCVNHSVDRLLGRQSAGTLRVSVDRRGLKYEIINPADTTAVRDAIADVKVGNISGSSFSFYITDEDWQEEGRNVVRLLRAVSLEELGPVCVPAYKNSSAEVPSAKASDAPRSAPPPAGPTGSSPWVRRPGESLPDFLKRCDERAKAAALDLRTPTPKVGCAYGISRDRGGWGRKPGESVAAFVERVKARARQVAA
jgi:uncharacterized protein